MVYAAQLLSLLCIGFLTLAWKINRAINLERSANSTGIEQKEIFLPWPKDNSTRPSWRSLILVLIMLTCCTASASIRASFTADKTSGCAPLIVNLSNHSVNGSSYQWNFGNGNVSSVCNPSTTFLTPGTYRITLFVSNGSSVDSVSETIQVWQPPVVDFTADRTTACIGDTITFSNNVRAGSSPVSGYAWGLGNGIALSNGQVRYCYAQPGTYNITLVAADSLGCSANLTKPAFIRVVPLPQAAFAASPANSCNATQLVSFTNQSVGNGLSYEWVLDSAVTSNQANPSHTYHQQIANIKLTVTDVNGCVNTVTHTVSAMEPVANFKASKVKACTGEKISFLNLSNLTGTAWLWNFGDGTTATVASPVKSYSQPGIYTVSFRIKNGSCADSITKVAYITIRSNSLQSGVSFVADSVFGCGAAATVHFANTTNVPGGVSYSWNFGNGDTSNIQNPTEVFAHPGNFSVTLTITDSNGCSVSGRMANFVQTLKPVARFTADTVTCPGGTIKFHNQSSGAISWLWNFGDGTTSTAGNPQHVYHQQGYYTISFTVYNQAGCDSTITRVHYVHVKVTDVNFRVSSTFSPCPPFACVLQNQSANDVDHYLWSFGDGYQDTAANPTHLFFYPGIYSVQLIGYTSYGCSDTIMRSNLVVVEGPTGTFSATPVTGCAPLQTHISASVSSNTQNAWCDFGDGVIVQDSLQLQHTYTSAKVYHPQFILTDHIGCTVTYPLDSIIVRNSPGIHAIDTSVCENSTLQISLPANAHYRWTPNQSLSCDTCSTVNIQPQQTTGYTVTAVDDFGCEATAQVNVVVNTAPVLNDSLHIQVCKNTTVNLFVGNAAHISWSPSTYLSNANCSNPVCTPESSIQYIATAVSDKGCSSNVIVPVVVIDKLQAQTNNILNVCSGQEVQLSASIAQSPNDKVVYQWAPASYFNNSTANNPIASFSGDSISLQLVVSAANCVSDTQNILVQVQPAPVIKVPALLTVAARVEVKLSATADQPLNFQWSAKDAMSCTECADPTLYPVSSQTIYVHGTNEFGCTADDSILLQVKDQVPGLFIPNAFTPNNDGTNDAFQLYSNGAGPESLHIQIFNRWGEKVFESGDKNFKWDGTANGNLLEAGVYTWQLQAAYDGNNGTAQSGAVTMFR